MSWRCRHGWHKWRFDSMHNPRTIDIAGRGAHHICTLTERCERCWLRRITAGAGIPRRVKVAA